MQTKINSDGWVAITLIVLVRIASIISPVYISTEKRLDKNEYLGPVYMTEKNGLARINFGKDK